ncbi:ABC transporter permease [Streptomyces sp. UNOC14_S4]|nr:ABC transporter permease [Streptomyces sp. UNOC14_S4]
MTTGARFAFAGGRESWLRTALTAVGVGVGVVLLLTAAAVPEMLDRRAARESGRGVVPVAESIGPRADTLLHQNVETAFRDKPVGGALLRAEGPKAPVPPGTGRLPGPGEMVVSPALEKLLASDDGELLRARFAYRSVGTIGDSGLLGPDELFYYAGSDRITRATGAERVDHFGGGESGDPSTNSPELLVLAVLTCVALLTPVAVFVATAARFGSEQRDRRLAALRLVGADIKAVRRIAAGEALCGSLIGLALGGGLFLAVRELVTGIRVRDISLMPSDLAPTPLFTALVVVAVAAVAVGSTLFALRAVTIEPLGVARNTTAPRRRLWWRLLLPAAGLALLAPAFSRTVPVLNSTAMNTAQIATGAVLVLLGVTALLPWLVEAVVARLRGGPLSWQLAVRRLQANSGPAARAVSGITVAVAGAIAVQMLFTGTENDFVKEPGRTPATHSQMSGMARAGTAAEVRGWTERLRATEGVVGAVATVDTYADKVGSRGPVLVTTVKVADCATLRELARLDSCQDGDVFVAQEPDGDVDTARDFPPGTELKAVGYGPSTGEGRALPWRVPASAKVVPTKPDPSGEHQHGVLATPSAFDMRSVPGARTSLAVKVREGDLDAIERVRNTAAGIDPTMRMWRMGGVVKDNQYAALERGLLAGGTLTLALIGASMLVSTLEQLRERRRALSALAAVGTRRSTLGWSVLWQTALPMAAGLTLAVAGGLTLGWSLLRLFDLPVRNWLIFLPMVGAGAAVILVMTAITLPFLGRVTRAEGLRTE